MQRMEHGEGVLIEQMAPRERKNKAKNKHIPKPVLFGFSRNG